MTTGGLITSTTLAAPVVGGPAVIQNEISETAVFASTQDQLLLRLSPDTGALRWTRYVGGRCTTPPDPSPPAVVLHAFTSTQPAFQMHYPFGTDLVVAWRPARATRPGSRPLEAAAC